MRELINLVEKNLTPAELKKHDNQYLKMLLQLAQAGTALPVDPPKRAQLGDRVTVTPDSVEALRGHIAYGTVPKTIWVTKADGTEVEIPTSALFKGSEFTGLEGKKAYNAGHLAELFMGLSITAKFLNWGQPVSAQQVMTLATALKPQVNGKNINFRTTQTLTYQNGKSRADTLNFLAVVPARSAEAFYEQAQAGTLSPDLNAVFNSAVKYVNESQSVTAAVQTVMKDPNSNVVDVISDGTSEAKGTKADLTLKIDGKKVNLLSLKTYSTDTLGQISGVGYDQVALWFKTSFGVDLSKYKSTIEKAQSKEQAFQLLLKLYDIYYPEIQAQVDEQSPGKEAAIVKNLANAANYHARGAGKEDVEIVKLDDKIKDGNYKILKFSDNLYDAMKHLDLETKFLKGDKGRTIQIWVKPAEGEKVPKGSNKLCQFRTQKMGDSYRNYFESGPMLEKLTELEQQPVTEEWTDTDLYVGDQDASVEVKPRRNNVKVYGREFQR